MQKDDLVYIAHMLDVARSIAAKAADKSRAEFDADDNLQLALTHLIQTIGEAATRVSQTFRELHPQIPWKSIIGMRHRVIHDYLEVDYDQVWEVVALDIDPLIAELERIAPLEPPESS